MSQVRIQPADWYETIRFADDVTLVHEPWIKPFFRCNMWHVRGRDRDLLFDTGLGHFSLRRHVKLVTERHVTCVASHSHFDHIGSLHEFPHRCVHEAEADILADPTNHKTLAGAYATDDMFIALPEAWDASSYAIKPAPAHQLLKSGDMIDLGNRVFEVIHTPGHSPGGIGLFEHKTGIFLSGDIIYDGPLIEDTYHSNISDYISTMQTLRGLNVSTIHGGHFPSFGPVRFHQLIDEYIDGKRRAGCHLG
jgi:glyoxylase-like metal-dependent hydrolase (beta-lactamase superfamily II)